MVVVKEKCGICGNIEEFCIDDGATLLREAKCSYCGASLRNSDVAEEIIRYVSGKDTGLRNLAKKMNEYEILNLCSTGAIHNALKECEHYTCSEYFEEIESGDYYEGILCVDLCNIPFHSNTFDIVVSEDVLEHVVNYQEAFNEIRRVLKPGGCHIFTVPLHEGRLTESRANRKRVYHGNPNPFGGSKGSLVITDWGKDIGSILAEYGYHSEIKRKHIFYKAEEITNVDSSYEEYLEKQDCLEMYYRYNSVVIASEKIKDDDLDSTEKFREQTIQDYKNKIDLMDKKIRKYNKIIRDKNDIIKNLNDDNEKRGLHIRKLDAEIILLRDEIQKKNMEILKLEDSAKRKN